MLSWQERIGFPFRFTRKVVLIVKGFIQIGNRISGLDTFTYAEVTDLIPSPTLTVTASTVHQAGGKMMLAE